MRALSSLSLAAVAVVSAVVLSGCSAGGSGSDGKLTYEDSPLAKYTTALWGEMDQAKFDEENAKIEELVAACMKKEGFEYQPGSNGGGAVIGTVDDMEERNTEKWIASNGYGMVQSQEEMKEQQANAEEFVDPNQEYVSSLSETEMSAYYETLHGPGPTEEEMAAMEEGDGSYEYNWETSGCYGAAQHEIQGSAQQAYDDPKYKPLFEKMNAVYTKAQEDPKIKEMDRKWADCMADAGFSELKAKNDAFTLISDEQNKIYENMETDEQGMPIGDSTEAFAELKQKEIDVALADFKCSEKLDYMQQSLKVQMELEQKFIDDNKSELDAMLAEYATKK